VGPLDCGVAGGVVVESLGDAEEMDGDVVVDVDVEDGSVFIAGAADGDAAGIEIDSFVFEFSDQRVANLVVGLRSAEADARGDLRGLVVDVAFEFAAGVFPGGVLPERNRDGGDQREGGGDFEFREHGG